MISKDSIDLLSKGRYGKILIETLEQIKSEVADVRNPLKVDKNIENEVRLGIIESLDGLLVEKLKIIRRELNPSEDNWN